MTMKWKILDTGVASAEKNMMLDHQLLKSLGTSQDTCILHFYDWEDPSATHGYFLDPYQSLSKNFIKKSHLHIAKRPTGGGIVLHISDFAFSVIVPASHPQFSVNTLDNYAIVNGLVAKAISKFLVFPASLELLEREPNPLDEACCCFCMAKPTQNDVMFNSKKVSGGAQRRTKFGFLHQGTISLAPISPQYLDELLIPGTRVREAMMQNSFTFLDASYTAKELADARQDLKRLLTEVVCQS